VEHEALHGALEVDPEVFAEVLREAEEAHTRVQQSADHELHRDPYRPEMAKPILARVPPDLDLLNEGVVLKAVHSFGFGTEAQSGARTWLIEFGYEALLDQIQGVPPGSRWLGTFSREEAVDRETIDFFATGHPLVEGILSELEEGRRGRVALLQVPGPEESFGLLALYKKGADFDVIAVDQKGKLRPDLARWLTAQALRSEPIEAKKWTSQASWNKVVQRMAAALPNPKPLAVAAFRVRKAG
jgi:RNA polymerase recycling family C-terminal